MATRRQSKIPPCAASMGCLCAGHARGNDADAACDTSEGRAPAPGEVRTVRHILANLHVSELTMSERSEVSRALDGVATQCAELRAEIEHGCETRRGRALVKRVRKALGYTYP